jgi:nucleoside 2-deoxyribosyltransferase
VANVFLTYAREDAAFADTLADALKRRGFGIWSNHQAIQPDEDWEQELRDHLTAADSVVVVLSPAAARSANTMFEIGAADALDKPIIAVNPAGSRPVEMRPAFFKRRQVLDGASLTPTEIAERVSRQLAV